MSNTKFSWDRCESPVIRKDVLILAPPGSGYETTVRHAQQHRLSIRNLGDCGYRNSSYSPYQWNINADELFYSSTAPWEKPQVWIGYADNLELVSCLPWAAKFKLLIPSNVYTERIIAYRRRTGLPLEGDQEVLAKLSMCYARLLALDLAALEVGTIPVEELSRVFLGLLSKYSKPSAIYPPKVVQMERKITGE